MKNEPKKSLVAEARRVQYEMTEGFYDPEAKEKDPTFFEIDKDELPPEKRDEFEQAGAELAEMAGISQEAAENAIFGKALVIGLEKIVNECEQEAKLLGITPAEAYQRLYPKE